MGRPKLSPVEKRAITTLRNRGFQVVLASGVEEEAKPERVMKTRRELAAGEGYSCSCGRKGLKMPVVSGSFHNDPAGTLHKVV